MSMEEEEEEEEEGGREVTEENLTTTTLTVGNKILQLKLLNICFSYAFRTPKLLNKKIQK